MRNSISPSGRSVIPSGSNGQVGQLPKGKKLLSDTQKHEHSRLLSRQRQEKKLFLFLFEVCSKSPESQLVSFVNIINGENATNEPMLQNNVPINLLF